jgi:hypothetical protein
MILLSPQPAISVSTLASVDDLYNKKALIPNKTATGRMK